MPSISGSNVSGVVTVGSGESATNNTVLSGGQIDLQSGATAGGNIINSGGVINVGNGAIDGTNTAGSGTTINSAGTLNVAAGGDAKGFTINSGGIVDAFGTVGRNAQINYGGTLTVESGGLLSNFVTNAGTIEIKSGGKAVNAITLTGTIANPSILKIDEGSDVGTMTIRGYTDGTDGREIDLSGYGFNPATTVTSCNTAGVLTITDPTIGKSLTLNIQGLPLGYTGTTTSDGSGGVFLVFGCFLAGTRIAGDGCEIFVEDLREGDLVATRVNGATVLRPVKWIGYRDVDVKRPGMEQLYPVRIRKNAFSDGLPRRDLLLTSEHCIYVDGGLIPVRMLVNGASILVDRSITTYTYYHVELEEHAIIVAEGLETESYLDTGNRGNFANAPVSSLRPLSMDDPAAIVAPLLIAPDRVKPIWTALRERADKLGFTSSAIPAECTSDPDLHLRIGPGEVIAPTARHDGQYRFILPAGIESAWLISRSAKPSEVVGPFLDDRRRLGVSVREITLTQGEQRWVIDHFDGGLTGWHAPEDASRWTNGAALVKLPALVSNAPATMTITITGTLQYPIVGLLTLAA